MIVSELKLYNFRRFKSVDGAPGLHMQSETYEKSNGVFDANWEIVDLRKETEV